MGNIDFLRERAELIRKTNGRRSVGHFKSWAQFRRFAETAGAVCMSSGPSHKCPFGVRIMYYVARVEE